ncbi:hypothetical protein [Streptomyces sp. DH12]|uniref:hypothetical protein n=1 Tax=Streptomyces sp. DH12 TaxID=2857010 RepID=UPI001E4713C6|nr:hypothetical protein [Streptomyces sp. DH12]
MPGSASTRDLDAVRPPSPDLVAAYAAQQIEDATDSLWPTASVRLGHIIPSVTSHVQQVTVEGRELYAKVSLLGVSLGTILRGSCGDWPTVKANQDAYVASPSALLAREAGHLSALDEAGLRVPAVAGYRHGVLFTEPVPGRTMGELVAADPDCTADVLHLAAGELDTALRHRRLAVVVDRSPIPERSISGTFLRKFNGISGPTYLAMTPHGGVLHGVVTRLRRAYRTPAPEPARRVVFGDLKPEHVLLPHDGRPVFIDPGLMRAHPCADTAKLVSRLVLGLIACPPPPQHTRAVLDGITAHLTAATAHLSAGERAAWLHHMATLWLMDTTNIVTTYLSQPPGLPLSPYATAVVARAGAVCRMLDLASPALTARRSSRDAWSACLVEAAQAAAL